MPDGSDVELTVCPSPSGRPSRLTMWPDDPRGHGDPHSLVLNQVSRRSRPLAPRFRRRTVLGLSASEGRRARYRPRRSLPAHSFVLHLVPQISPYAITSFSGFPVLARKRVLLLLRFARIDDAFPTRPRQRHREDYLRWSGCTSQSLEPSSSMRPSRPRQRHRLHRPGSRS